jgi:uncharacterized protein
VKVTADLVSCVANDRLHLILMPTEACNFRCSYCYEDFRYTRMEASVLRGVKRFLSHRADSLRVLEISWFGGEPLLAMDIIGDVSQHVADLSCRHPQLFYDADITTNAYLLSRARFEQLLGHGVTRFQISFDGPREWHDRKRVLANGLGTFDRVWGNLLALRDVQREFHVLVRLHVDRENLASLPEFIREYAEAFRDDDRFELFIRRLACLGGPNDAELPVIDENASLGIVRELSQFATSLAVRHVTVEQHAPVCYAARGNSYVVRANGRLNKCTVALEHPNNQVGRIREDGLLDLDVPRMGPWMRGLWSGDREELECPMRGYADPGTARSGNGASEGQVGARPVSVVELRFRKPRTPSSPVIA